MANGVGGIEERLAGVHHACDATIGRLKGIHPRGVRLLRLARVVNGVIEHDHRAAAFRLRVAGQRDAVVEVDRTVGADGRRGTHRAYQHHRLVTFHDEAQEISRLLHRVRAVGDDDAIHVFLFQ